MRAFKRKCQFVGDRSFTTSISNMPERHSCRGLSVVASTIQIGHMRQRGLGWGHHMACCPGVPNDPIPNDVAGFPVRC